jgi:hypothetical protein
VHEDIPTWSTNNDTRACVYLMQINDKKTVEIPKLYAETCGNVKLLVIKGSPVYETSALCGV